MHKEGRVVITKLYQKFVQCPTECVPLTVHLCTTSKNLVSKWFPDRRGMATGMAIMGFGGGAMIATPLTQWLLQLYRTQPQLLSDARVETRADGARYDVATGNEVVVVGNGTYVVGSGDTGAALTFLTIGVVHFAVMTTASMMYR